MGRSRKRRKEREPSAETTTARGSVHEDNQNAGWMRLWIGITLAALLLRIILLPYSPKITYPGDHDDFVRWAVQATDQGVLTLYDHAPDRRDMRVWDKNRQRWFTTQRQFDRVCNYPPGIDLSTIRFRSGIQGVQRRSPD